MDDRIHLYNTATATRQDPALSCSARSIGGTFALLGLTPAAVLTGHAPAGEIAARCEAALVHAPQGVELHGNGPLRDWAGVVELLAIATEGDPEEDHIIWGLG